MLQLLLFARYKPVANSLVDAQACSAELTEFERMTEDQVPPQDLYFRPSSSINNERLHGRFVACFN